MSRLFSFVVSAVLFSPLLTIAAPLTASCSLSPTTASSDPVSASSTSPPDSSTSAPPDPSYSTPITSTSSPAPPSITTGSTSSIYVPYYDATANKHTSPARGWNSFGLQANQGLYGEAGFDFNDYHFAQQCDLLQVQQGYDYICSIDSGWSKNGGDKYARIEPDPAIFSWFGFQGFADHLHQNGMKLGVYLLPGAFESDKDTVIEGTNIKLGDVLDFDQPWFSLRRSFKWDQDGVQQWHDSVVKYLASLGVDMIKLDYLTPGSPDAGQDLPTDTSPAATMFHNAILKYGNGMRLDLSWKLSREAPYWTAWQSSADSLRLDQDINNSGQKTFTSWATVQRAIENYRIFINQQVLDESRRNTGIHIRPDMDNTYYADPESLSGLNTVQRYTMAIHWIGAGANLISGADLTHMDDLGKLLMFDQEVMNVAAFTSQWPMQPRNPDNTTNPGGPDALQTQAWIAGPNEQGTAVLVLANYGPDQGSGGYGTNNGDAILVAVNLKTIGLEGQWFVRRVLGGGGRGGEDKSDIGTASDQIASWLGPGESVMYKLQSV